MLRVRQISLWTFLRLVGQYAKGRYREYPELIDHYHGQRVEFSALEPITVVVDGEVMRDTRFTVRLSEKKINFFYPAGADYRVKDLEGRPAAAPALWVHSVAKVEGCKIAA